MRDLFGNDKEEQAIEFIRSLKDPTGVLIVGFSYGKDSCLLWDLVKRAGVAAEAWYSVTCIEPAGLISWGKVAYPEVKLQLPKRSIYQGILKKGLPTRKVRWCCELLKEQSGEGRVVAVGVRAAESARRARTWKPLSYFRNSAGRIIKTLAAPILNWTDDEVWPYIRKHDVPYCPLYDQGYKRIGCVPCPMQGEKRLREALAAHPKIARELRRHADLYLDAGRVDSNRKLCSMTNDEYWEWWLSGKAPKRDEAQLDLWVEQMVQDEYEDEDLSVGEDECPLESMFT
jgi:phosphoadenosine phosphosulfate reductase